MQFPALQVEVDSKKNHPGEGDLTRGLVTA
jgi:hypothetical protein